MEGYFQMKFAVLKVRKILMGFLPLFLVCCTGMLIVPVGPPALAADELLEQGRRIYQEGVLPSGDMLKGVRFDKVEVKGSHAACINCHRRSGMGAVEGNILVPPITGRYLFPNPDDKAMGIMDTFRNSRFSKQFRPYTDSALADAIRRGVNSEGRDMSPMMPRYALSEQEMKALLAYLRHLSKEWAPGVTRDTIRFAAIITPEVEPERRKAMIDTMQAAFAQKNGSTALASSRGGGRRRTMNAAEIIYGTGRNWELEVWELEGRPETWAKQLEKHYLRKPVFAVAGGLSNTTWEPIQSFCRREHIPCWFPSVDLPVQEEDFYSVYFSRGVALEADVLAKHLQ